MFDVFILYKIYQRELLSIIPIIYLSDPITLEWNYIFIDQLVSLQGFQQIITLLIPVYKARYFTGIPDLFLAVFFYSDNGIPVWLYTAGSPILSPNTFPIQLLIFIHAWPLQSSTTHKLDNKLYSRKQTRTMGEGVAKKCVLFFCFFYRHDLLK